MPNMLHGVELCLCGSGAAAEPAVRALQFAATLACGQGARLVSGPQFEGLASPFYAGPGAPVEDPKAWAQEDPARRVVLTAGPDDVNAFGAVPNVHVVLDTWHSEATLFAASGLADLNGAPDGAPLVPAAHYASQTIGYAVHTALVAVHAKTRRSGQSEQAVVDGVAVLKWINWKAIAAGAMGTHVSRMGAMAEWPVLACRDGHVAILFTERDWPAMVKMVGDPALADPKFGTFQGREAHRGAYLPILQHWCADRTKDALRAELARYEIPGDTVRTLKDLLECELFAHRQSFVETEAGRVPALPERVLARAAAASPRPPAAPGSDPLSGLRVLDLGIITAGAGVGAVLANLGAEVLKIESETYPDPFRQWAGSSESPLFRFNSRNKYGIGIDLKTPEGKAQFLDLVRDADIVVENFRRGVIERLGLGFDTLKTANPSILLASISGQGHGGPGTGGSTFGSTLEANAGFATLTRDETGQPYVTGRALNFPDQVICLYGAGVAAAAALHCRETGQGQHLDISQRDTVLFQIGDVIQWVAGGGTEAGPDLQRGIGRPALDGIFACSDGYVALTAPDPGDLSGVDGLPADVGDWALERRVDEAVAAFLGAGFGAARAVSGTELSKDRGLFAAAVLARDPEGHVVKRFPFQFSRVPMRIERGAPKIGQHNHRLMRKVPAQ